MSQKLGEQFLDSFSLEFHLGPHGGDDRERSFAYANRVPEERFHEAAEYVMNQEFLDEVDDEKAFRRALRLEGFIVQRDKNKARYTVTPGIASEMLKPAETEVRSILDQLGFQAVKKDLKLAMDTYSSGDFPQSLVMMKKAFEDTTDLIAQQTNSDRATILSKVLQSEPAIELAKKFYWFSNLSHKSKLSDDEAILGYNAGVAVIHHIISVYSKSRKPE